jgi:hypothetical protein
MLILIIGECMRQKAAEQKLIAPVTETPNSQNQI